MITHSKSTMCSTLASPWYNYHFDDFEAAKILFTKNKN